MTHVSIFPASSHGTEFHAVAGDKQSVGRTAGEALDALTPQLPQESTGAIIILQAWRSDEFFEQRQRDRLQKLMELWRAARDRSEELPPALQAELDALAAAELNAAGLRAEQILRDSQQ